ncbi:UDP-N-acetylmuramate dehydrogenase [Patescibacteria group bacterium]|nr:UDP-N-acetylmuramate dehydrogenase [Patescibacteria group bacterium]
MNLETIEKLQKNFPSILIDEPMSKHTNLRIGGPAKLFYAADTVEDLIDALQIARREQIPWYVFGGGSNMLVSDDGFDGLMIQIAFRDIKMRSKSVTADAGAITASLARQTVEAGLSGLEWAVGIPGTVGGAVFGNSGAWGGEIKDTLVSVDCIDLATMKQIVYPNAVCSFGYRDSRFKHEPHIILRATFGLKPAEDSTKLTTRMNEIMNERKEKQPTDNPSAGCIFKNFVFKDESEIEKLKNEVKDIPVEMLDRKSLSAGWLVSQSGMKGERIGDAQISEKHGNFIINLGNARAQDILMLTSKVKMKIRDEYNILLEDEVQLAGF